MAPTRTMTGDTAVFNDKETAGLPSPTSPTNTDHSGETLREDGDAIIEIADDNDGSTTHSSSDSDRSDNDTQSQNEKSPTFFRRISGPFKSAVDPEHVTEIKTRKLEDTPNGFPRLAAFQSSEANFALYRSFSYLHSRVLLDLQDEITELEKELDDFDLDDEDENPLCLISRSTDIRKAHQDEARWKAEKKAQKIAAKTIAREAAQQAGNEDDWEVEFEVDWAARNAGGFRNRRIVLKELQVKLLEYDRLLIKARTLESFQRPSDRNYRSVRRYLYNQKPLGDSEMESIRCKEDVVSLRSGREWAAFDGGVETMIGRMDRVLQKIIRTDDPPLQRFFRTPELRAKTDDKSVSYYSSCRIDQLVNILITFVIFILLVIPVITMYHLTSTSMHGTDLSAFVNGTASNQQSPATVTSQKDTFNAVGVLMIFTLLFSAAMSMLTKAARHELFAASAAYCAILVVFIGNFTGPGN